MVVSTRNIRVLLYIQLPADHLDPTITCQAENNVYTEKAQEREEFKAISDQMSVASTRVSSTATASAISATVVTAQHCLFTVHTEYSYSKFCESTTEQ